MAITPKSKAFAFAGILLLVATAMVGTSIASTGTALGPFVRGEGFAQERSMTRGQHVALGIRVGEIVGGEIEPLEGALVVVRRPGGAQEDAVATQTTNADGFAVFELKPGAYNVTVSKGDLVSWHQGSVSHSMRVTLTFDESGVGHWNDVPHRDLEKRREAVSVIFRVGRNESGTIVPAEGAVIQIFAVSEDGARTLVKQNTTGPRGYASFHLPRGQYAVNVSLDGVSAEHRLPLRHPMAIGVLFDGDHVEWKAWQEAHPPERDARHSPSTHPSLSHRPENAGH